MKPNPVLVEVTRGPLVESEHRGAFAIADASGAIIAGIGAIDVPVFPRSAMKMIQALPLVESGAADAFALGAEHLALACASHSGEAMHVEPVRQWLARIDASEADLGCGPHWPHAESAGHDLVRAGKAPSRVHNNCSGKHTGFLTLARHMGAPLAGYLGTGHRVQGAVKEALASICDVPEGLWSIGIDGCAAPNFALPLAVWARGMARLASGQGLAQTRARAARRLTAAMRDHSLLMSGTGRACHVLMQAATRGTCLKTGAEGFYIGILEEQGLGIALKIDDGATRASETGIAALLVAAGALDAEKAEARQYLAAPVLNTMGLKVGERRPAPALSAVKF